MNTTHHTHPSLGHGGTESHGGTPHATTNGNSYREAMAHLMMTEDQNVKGSIHDDGIHHRALYTSGGQSMDLKSMGPALMSNPYGTNPMYSGYGMGGGQVTPQNSMLQGRTVSPHNMLHPLQSQYPHHVAERTPSPGHGATGYPGSYLPEISGEHSRSSAASTPSSQRTTPTNKKAGGTLLAAHPDSVYCSRCRNYKHAQDFLDGDKRRKTCSACRQYGKKYIKKKSLSETVDTDHISHVMQGGVNSLMATPGGSSGYASTYSAGSSTGHASTPVNAVYPPTHSPYHNLDSSLTVFDDILSSNRKFIQNMKWMVDHIEQNADNANHIYALNQTFGDSLKNAREAIEAEFANQHSLHKQPLRPPSV